MMEEETTEWKMENRRIRFAELQVKCEKTRERNNRKWKMELRNTENSRKYQSGLMPVNFAEKYIP